MMCYLIVIYFYFKWGLVFMVLISWISLFILCPENVGNGEFENIINKSSAIYWKRIDSRKNIWIIFRKRNSSISSGE